jgi:hypothetical protein
MTARTFNNPLRPGTDVHNTRAWRAAEIPAAKGHASSAGIAMIASGFMRSPATEPCGRNAEAFDHAGGDGSLGFATRK